ncbi:hypothetical protein ACGFNV_35505 [Streptomyces sp. NPDC048751]|uniref:hypothetical protein n=1 Tax=Streptomyces sp. NPDC048751 TaxID=3365591 RepID=UPI003716CAEE
MNIRRILNYAAAAVTVTALVLFGASPVSAYPNWQTYKSNSNWDCGITSLTRVSDNVVFQTCWVITPDKTKGQVVLVVSNRGTKDVVLRQGHVWSDELEWGVGYVCNEYTLAGGQARACFGKTREFEGCGVYVGRGALYANSLDVDYTLGAPYAFNGPCP